jgi:hypothetical protein
MSWTVNLLENNLRITRACAKELFSLLGLAGEGIFYELEEMYREGELQFSEEHMEHIDYLRTEGVIEILKKYHADGRVLFGQLQGDGGAKFWGHEFMQGNYTELTGEVHWSDATGIKAL